jgi:ubiquinone biosynthesis protein
MVSQFAEGLRNELDFRKEADAMVEMAQLMGDQSAVAVPRVHRQLCTRRLIVQERFEGFTLADRADLVASQIDRIALAQVLLRSTLDQVMTYGFFHADPHPGNVFALDDGRLGLIDFGAVGRLDSIQQSAVIDILAGLASRDVNMLREGLERVVDFTETASPDHLERALARLMADHMRQSGVVDPAILQDLVAMLSRFGVRLPTDLVVLSRALVTVDGTLRVLAPELSLVAAATEMMTTADEPLLHPEALLRAELVAMLPHLRRLPERVDRILTLTGRGELRLRHVIDEDGRRILRTFVNRGLLVAIGAVFAAISTILLVATDAGPAVGRGVGLFEVLGYGGLLCGTMLLLRVAAAVARDGTT